MGERERGMNIRIYKEYKNIGSCVEVRGQVCKIGSSSTVMWVLGIRLKQSAFAASSLPSESPY